MKMLLKLYKLPAKDLVFFAEALGWIYLSKVMLLIVPYKLCIRTVKSSSVLTGTITIENLKKIRTAIRRANKLVFWKNVCLVQSFAASWMLQRRGIKSSFFIGINHDGNKKLIAHAWIMVDNFEVVPQGGDYNILTQY